MSFLFPCTISFPATFTRENLNIFPILTAWLQFSTFLNGILIGGLVVCLQLTDPGAILSRTSKRIQLHEQKISKCFWNSIYNENGAQCCKLLPRFHKVGWSLTFKSNLWFLRGSEIWINKTVCFCKLTNVWICIIVYFISHKFNLNRSIEVTVDDRRTERKKRNKRRCWQIC